jgi:spermidine synthase
MQIHILLWGVGLSGAAAILYEVAWIRLLSLVLGSSTHAFSFMLAAFIAGIALGSFVVARRGGGFDSYLRFAFAELAVVFSMVLTLPFYERLPFYFLQLANLFIRTPDTFWIYQALQFSVCFVLMLLPTFFLGMALPLATQATVQSLSRLGGGVGNTFAANTAGAIIGILGAGLLLPVLGIKRLIELGILANLLVGLLGLRLSPALARKHKKLLYVAAAIPFFTYLYLSPAWDERLISSGVFRMRGGFSSVNYEAFKKNFQEKVVYYKDGANMTVAVTQGKDNRLVLKVNGKSDASSRGDLPTQVLLGQLPLLLKPDARKILVIGLGSGVTAGSVLRHPVTRTDVVEISPEVVEASRFFAPYNHEPLQDQRLRLYIEDAKAFLKVAPENYDIIISEPSNPWVAGIGNLYSLEFYRDVRARLTPSGLMIQWIHGYEMTDEILQLVLRTFAASFEHVTLWNTDFTDLILVGSRKPLRVDFEKSAARLNEKKINDDLRRVGIDGLPTILSLQVASDRSVRKAAGEGRLNEDLFPILEYEAPKAFFLGQTSGLPASFDERRYPAERSNLYFTRYLKKHRLTLQEAKNLANYHLSQASLGRWDLGSVFVDYWLRLAPGDPEARWALVRIEERSGHLESARRELASLLELRPDRLDYLEAASRLEFQSYVAKRSLFNAHGPEKVLGYLHRLLQHDGVQKDRFYRMIGEIYAADRDYPNALVYLEKAAFYARNNKGAFQPDALWVQAAAVALEAGLLKQSEAYARQALEHNAGNGTAKKMLEQTSKRIE